MSGITAADKLYSAIEESAGLVGAPFSRDKVWPILAAFPGAFGDGGIVFSVHAGEHHAEELNYAFTVPPEIGDPYAHALNRGFIAETAHPVNDLLSDIEQRCSVSENFVDCGVVGGFRKLYAHFPRDLKKVSELADIPSMPPAVGENVSLFTRYGLDRVAMIGINYKEEALSLYFQFDAETRPAQETFRAMLYEFGLAEPDERLLAFAHNTLRANVTLSWVTSKIIRVALAPAPRRGVSPGVVPARIEPPVERFATCAPRTYDGERVNLFAVKWSAAQEYIEVCSYYQLSAMQKLFLDGE